MTSVVMSLFDFYIRNEDGSLEKCGDPRKAHEFLSDPQNLFIEESAVPYGDMKEAVIVKTVFLGFDHGWGEERPLLFETNAKMPGKHEDLCQKYATEQEARAGHVELCHKIHYLLADLQSA